MRAGWVVIGAKRSRPPRECRPPGGSSARCGASSSDLNSEAWNVAASSEVAPAPVQKLRSRFFRSRSAPVRQQQGNASADRSREVTERWNAPRIDKPPAAATAAQGNDPRTNRPPPPLDMAKGRAVEWLRGAYTTAVLCCPRRCLVVGGTRRASRSIRLWCPPDRGQHKTEVLYNSGIRGGGGGGGLVCVSFVRLSPPRSGGNSFHDGETIVHQNPRKIKIFPRK